MASRVSFNAVIVVTYSVGALAYGVYSAQTGKGIGGWILDMNYQLTGILAPRLACVLTFVVVAVPGWVAAGKFMRSAVPANGPARGPRRAVWPVFLLVTILGGLFPWGLYRWLVSRDAEDQKRVIEEVDLRHRAEPGQGTKFVRLTGYQPSDVTFEITDTINSGLASKQTFTPLAAQNGATGEPIAWFFEGSLREEFRPGPSRIQQFEAERHLYGEITRDGMPRYLESAFKKAGVRISNPYYSVEPVEVRDGHIVSRVRGYEILPWFGFAAGPAAFLVSIFVWLFIRRPV